MLPSATPVTGDFLVSDAPATRNSRTYLNTTIPSGGSEQVAGDGMTAKSVLPKSWSSTLLLPKSAFPPRPLPAHRPKYLKRCTDELYASQKSRVQNSSVFVLHDGPPYANGDLHVGHALNKVLKDIINRFQLSQGKIIKYVPGWDCHGLPIELKALEEQKKASKNSETRQLGAIAIRHVARDLALKTVKLQKEQFRRWGIMADWENAWKTMDVDYELRQLDVFSEMVSRGLIYRRFKPVYWSPSSATALAEAELEYKDDHVSWSAFVRFPLASWPQFIATRVGLEADKVNVVVWTTTPWTLPANKAVAVNINLEYTIVTSATYGNLLVAISRVDEVEKICKETLSRNDSIHFNGAELVGASYRNPLLGFESSTFPILQADFVSADSGSGLVHLAPGHGMDDYKLCLQHNISPYAPLDDFGKFTEFALPTKPDLLVGKPVLDEGNKAVLDHLAELGLLVGRHKFKHKYPYDWRSKQPVIIRATEQWFADVGEIRAAALNSLQAVSFIPKSGKERLQSFVNNRSEWCISRQRAWGVPIPALYHGKTGKAILTKASISHIISIIKARGFDAWWSDSEFDPVWTPTELREQDGETLYRRGKDTMDVWFDSGTSWTQMENLVGRKPSDTVEDGAAALFPAANVYLEGSDQHRGWFQSSLLTYIARQNDLTAHTQAHAPFQRLITHGFTLDQAGRKMSKSIGNVISPNEIMDGTLLPPLKRNKSKNVPAAKKQVMYDAMGPDALRLWVASSDYSKDVIIGQPVLKDVSNSLLKFRVTFKLLLGLLDDYEPSKCLTFDQLGFIDQLALMHLREADLEVRKFYQEYEFYKAVNAIKKYINIDLSAFYFESIKDIVYAEAAGSKARLAAQSTLVHILNGILCMLSPITPLLVEEVWDYTPDRIKTRLAHPFERQWVEWAASEGAVGYLHPAWRNDQLASDAPYLSAANVGIKGAQEVARSLGKMGSSLQSFVLLQLGDTDSSVERRMADVFRRYNGKMEALFVTSKVEICTGPLPTHVLHAEWWQSRKFQIDSETAVAHVYAPQKVKCIRCWKYAAPPSAAAEVALCSRCEVVVDGLSKGYPELFKDSMDSVPTIAV